MDDKVRLRKTILEKIDEDRDLNLDGMNDVFCIINRTRWILIIYAWRFNKTKKDLEDQIRQARLSEIDDLMAKKGIKRPQRTHTKPRNDAAAVPEIQGKAKCGKEQARPIIAGTDPMFLERGGSPVGFWRGDIQCAGGIQSAQI